MIAELRWGRRLRAFGKDALDAPSIVLAGVSAREPPRARRARVLSYCPTTTSLIWMIGVMSV